MSRLFHSLVIAGAAISAAACAGESKRTVGDEGATGGSGGAGAGGSGIGAGGSGIGAGGSGIGAGGSGMGAEGGSAGSTAGTGGAGGSRSGTGGSDGGSQSAGAGTGAIGLGGLGGTAGAGSLPEPGEAANWDCTGATQGDCVQLLGTTATVLTGDCVVDPDRPKTAADCDSKGIFSCSLAVSASGEALLVNCECLLGSFSCTSCYSPFNHRIGQPATCDETSQVCECAYTGILK